MFYVIHLRILNLIVVLKVDLQLSYLPAFSFLSWKTIQVGKTSMAKLKFKHLDGVFGMLRLFGILKLRGFAFVQINVIL